MIDIRKTGIYFLLAVLVLCIGLISCQPSQEKQQSMNITEAKKIMAEIVQRMEGLQTEVSQMQEVLLNNPEAVMGDQEVVTLTPEQMLEMLQNMNQLVEKMGQLMVEIDQLVSNEELMMNEALRDRATNLVDKMDSCVKYMEGIWSGAQN